MASPVMLAVDVVLGAMIGPPGCPAEMVIERAEAGEWTPVILDLALFCAMSSLSPEDKVDHARLARLLRLAELAPTMSREGGTPLEPPSRAEIENWRTVALGEPQNDADDDADDDDDDDDGPSCCCN